MRIVVTIGLLAAAMLAAVGLTRLIDHLSRSQNDTLNNIVVMLILAVGICVAYWLFFHSGGFRFGP